MVNNGRLEFEASGANDLPGPVLDELDRVLGLPSSAQDSQVSLLVEVYPKHAVAIWQHVAMCRNLSTAFGGKTMPWLTEPKQLGGYQILETLKSGGMGAVYVAADPKLDRRVAIKTILPALLLLEPARERFDRETKALARLQHPGICTLFERGEEAGLPYMVLELIEGNDLDSLLALSREQERKAVDLSLNPGGPKEDGAAIRTGQRIVGEVVALFEKVARAVDQAHRLQLVHRDLKPANIMVRTDGEPVVLDFGLALHTADGEARLSATGDAVGTWPYMSPEQVDQETIDHRTDVWSLGVSMYEALCLQLPFDAGTRGQLSEQIRVGDPPKLRARNPYVPKSLEIVVATAMAKNPDDRYRSAELLADDLRRVREHRPVLARPVRPWIRLLQWTRRNPAASFLIVSVIVGSWVGLWQYQTSRTNELIAESRRLRSDMLVHGLRLSEARRDELSLYPASPEMIEPMRQWLARHARQLRTSKAFVKEAIRQLSLDPNLSKADRRDHEALLSNHLEELEEFDPVIRGVERRLSWAENLRAASVADHRVAWARARASIKSADGVVASTAYRDHPIDLEPRVGLVPLGIDPVTKLWEFYHLRTAADLTRDTAPAAVAIPQRNESRRLEMTARTGLVFVLVPGGTFLMGTQTDPNKKNYFPVPERDGYEGPVHAVKLAPFFISKYEMTQAQWVRLAASNPAYYQAGKDTKLTRVDGRHPVESVNHPTCVGMLSKAGLELPTEAQWEYACRAGTHAPWSTGRKERSLEGHANLRDLTYASTYEKQGLPRPRHVVPIDDGWVFHAPVGSFQPNAFGLHDMHGNVSEWCLESFGRYDFPVADQTGRRQSPPGYSPRRLTRGGSFSAGSWHVRSGARDVRYPDEATSGQGVRPALKLVP